ncbi:unnamed protein product, partial [Mesorhabditis spiculigera]
MVVEDEAKKKRSLERFKPYMNNHALPRAAFDNLTVDLLPDKDEKLGFSILRELVVKVNPNSVAGGKVKVGDLILSVNGKADNVKAAMVALSKSGKEGKLEIARLRTRFVLPVTAAAQLPNLMEGFEYSRIVLYFLKGLPVGLTLVAIEEKVYVDHVDPDSSSAMTFGQGDCILEVEGVRVTSVAQVNDYFKQLAAKSSWATMLCEAPDCDMTRNMIRNRINAARDAPPPDLGLPPDVIEFLKSAKIGAKTPTPILKEDKEKKDSKEKKDKAKRAVHFEDKSLWTPTPVDGDMKLLVKPAPIRNAAAEGAPVQKTTEQKTTDK